MKSFDVFFKTIVDVKNFVNIVNKYDFDIDLESGRYVIDAKSIMGIFSLNLAQPIKIYIHSVIKIIVLKRGSVNMREKIKLETTIILLLSITIVFVGIGFIYLSMRYNSVKKTKEKYEVNITKIIKGNVINGSNKHITTNSEITDNKKTAKFSLNLKNNKDSVSYIIVIKNTGSLSAQIDNIIERTNYSKDLVTIKYNDIVGEVIEPGDEIELELNVLSPNKNILSKDFIYQITILTSNIN